MKNNRILIFVLLLLLVLLLALGGLFVWLSGGTEEREEDGARTAQGLVHVRSIYVANGENLIKPVGIGADTDGSFFVTLRDGQRVVEFDRGGDWVRTFGEKGLGQGQLMVATGVAVDRLAGHVYVTDRSRLRLICYSPQGEFLWEVPLLNPLSPAVTPDGIVVTTFGPLVSLTTQGEPVGEVGSRGPDVGQFDYARSAAVLEGGDIVVADSNNNRVQRVKISGEVTATSVWVDGEPPRFQDDPAVTYGLPSGVTADTRGRVFVLDGFRQEIVVLDARTGKRLHVFEDLQGKRDGHFSLPTGIAHLGGDRFAITDTYNDRVQIVRLLLPGEDQLVARYPWLWGALPAGLLLLLAMVLGRKRHFATQAALGRASHEGHLRLLAAVGRKLRVLPEVLEEFADAEEAGIGIGEYLMAVGTEGGSDANQRLLDAARPGGWQKVLPARSRLIVRDDAEAAEFAVFRGRILTVDQLAETFTVGDAENRAGKTPTSEPEVDGNGR